MVGFHGSPAWDFLVTRAAPSFTECTDGLHHHPFRRVSGETWGQTGCFLIFCHVVEKIPRGRRPWNPTLAQKAAQGWGTPPLSRLALIYFWMALWARVSF